MVDKPIPDSRMPFLGASQPMKVDYRTLGSQGLNLYGGFLLEEKNRDLQGPRANAIYREMGDADATCGTMLFAIDKVARQVKWRTERASDHPRDRAAADFLDECRDDLDTTWTDLISEILTMLQFGFSIHERVYKRRGGSGDEAWMRSRYKDGRIGWRGFPIRSQETIYRWLTDEMGNIKQVEQIAPPLNMPVIMDMDKLLLFRTSTHKGNPAGRSIFRSAYRSFYLKRGIENIEAVGVERDLAGLPVAYVPPEVLAGNTTADATMLTAMKQIVTNIRRDEQEGVIFPLQYDQDGKKLYELTLLTSGGSRNFDTDKIISRYDSRIAMCALMDFLLLGQNASAQGSWAMHSDKTKLFLQALGAFLDIIADTFNRFAVPQLFDLNSFKIDEHPRLAHDSVEAVDLKDIGEFLKNVTAAGAAIFPNASIEARLCEMAGLPNVVDPEREKPVVEPMGDTKPKDVEEIHDGDMLVSDLAPDPDTVQANALQQATGTITKPAKRIEPVLKDK